MGTRYIPDTSGVTVIPVPAPLHRAPAPGIASMLNYPKQSMPAVQPEPQNFDYRDASFLPVGVMSRWLNTDAAVQWIPVTQPAHTLKAPLRFWNRNRWQMPYQVGRADRYPQPGVQAPRRYQSIPGYVVTQTQVQTSEINANLAPMYTGLRAPGMNEGSKPCR